MRDIEKTDDIGAQAPRAAIWAVRRGDFGGILIPAPAAHRGASASARIRTTGKPYEFRVGQRKATQTEAVMFERSIGVTETERLLADLCERSFLKL